MGGDGAHGAGFVSLFTIFLVVTAFFYLLVIGALIAATVRGRRSARDGKSAGEGDEPAMRRALYAWVGLTGMTLIGLTFASYFTDRAWAALGAGEQPLVIDVTANQWWWDVQYQGAAPSERLRTANELHLPAGRPAIINLKSNDVIHSLWIPNLAGKQDLIPGRDVDLALLPRRVGQFRSQCAEFCGAQHAHMALDVTVESPAAFAAWRQHQLAPAAEPRTPLAVAGQVYFTTRQCSMCHSIAGTTASAQVAPDLTHFASRRSIAAGTLPMRRGNLYGWLADPQGIKPGNHMPVLSLSQHDLDSLVAYLETLS